MDGLIWLRRLIFGCLECFVFGCMTWVDVHLSSYAECVFSYLSIYHRAGLSRDAYSKMKKLWSDNHTKSIQYSSLQVWGLIHSLRVNHISQWNPIISCSVSFCEFVIYFRFRQNYDGDEEYNHEIGAGFERVAQSYHRTNPGTSSPRPVGKPPASSVGVSVGCVSIQKCLWS